MKIDLVGDAYHSRSGSEDFQTSINLFTETGDDMSKYEKILYPTPGLELFSQLDGSVVRGLIEFDGSLYAVCDRKFYKIDSNGVASLKGTLNPTGLTNPVSMAVNGLQVAIVDQGYGYVYTIATDTFGEITNSYFTAAAPTYITFQDGYGIYNENGTNRWWFTAINDFTMTSALDFYSADTSNQDVLAIVSNKQIIYLFTKVGVEIWYNAGSASSPLARKNTSYNTQGTAAPLSIAQADGTLYYLTSSVQGDGFVVMIQGESAPVVVSTPAINFLINQIDNIADAIAFVYQEDGHLFYVLTFPSGDKTFVYDIAEKAWHTRASTIVNDPGAGTRQGRIRANCYAFLNGKHIVGDFENGKLYEMRSDVYTEDGELIIRERTSPHLWSDLKRLTLRSLTLDVQPGVGNLDCPDPKLNLYVSRDSGFNYGNAHIASLGKAGEYNTRVKFNRLGTSRDFVFKIVISDPVNFVLLGASAEIEQSDS